jgi:hypothetical protein
MQFATKSLQTNPSKNISKQSRKTSRRDFMRKLGISGLAAMSLPKVVSATNSIEGSQESDKRNGVTLPFQGDSITDGNRTRNKD